MLRNFYRILTDDLHRTLLRLNWSRISRWEMQNAIFMRYLKLNFKSNLFGAGDGDRTHCLLLGKETFYRWTTPALIFIFCAEDVSRTHIACSSDRCLDHLGYLSKYIFTLPALKSYLSAKVLYQTLWTLRDSNPRHLQCKWSALANWAKSPLRRFTSQGKLLYLKI